VSARSQPILTWRATAWRSRVVLFLIIGALIAVMVKAFALQHLHVEQWQKRAEVRFERVRDIPAARGRLLDRNGVALAVSIPEHRLGLVPSHFNKALQAQAQSARKLDELSSIVGIPKSEILRRAREAKQFFYLTSGLDLEKADQIRALKIKGLELEQEFRRHYPYGEVFANVVGFTGQDDRGQEGIEKAFDKILKGEQGSERVLVDRRNVAFGQRQYSPAAPGDDLRLSLDTGLQTIAFQAVRDAMQQHRAKAASAVVLDARTGELLAMVNAPSFNPNERQRLDPAKVRNRVVTDTFEPGSTLKPFTIATALDAAVIRPDTRFQTASGMMTISGRTIRDSSPHGNLDVNGILEKSSNIGMAQIALRLPAQTLFERHRMVGFGSTPLLELPGMVSGRLRPWQGWVAIDQATLSYGHGVSVSLLQLARAYTVFTRGGEILPVSLTPVTDAVIGEPVFSSVTASRVRDMLERATGPDGTAPKARIQGFRVAGKTGTAHKPERGGYAKNRYIASFVGFVPVEQPRFIIGVMVDEPAAGEYYGGQVAAPVFARIASEGLRRLQMSPDPAIRILPDPMKVASGAAS